MNGTIFFETLRRNARQMIYWGLGLAVYALYPFLFLPAEGGLEQYAELMESFDPAILRSLGINDSTLIGTPEGFVGYSFFGFILLIMGVFAVIAGLNITATEEDNGTMDVFLSLPVARWQVIVEKLAAYTVVVTGIAFMSFIGIMIGANILTDKFSAETIRILEACLGIVPPTVMMIAFTAFVATLVRRRGMATAISGGFVVVSYLLNSVASAANSQAADAFKQLSVFNHYAGTEVLIKGLEVESVILLIAVIILLTLASVELFKRRDIAV